MPSFPQDLIVDDYYVTRMLGEDGIIVLEDVKVYYMPPKTRKEHRERNESMIRGAIQIHRICGLTALEGEQGRLTKDYGTRVFRSIVSNLRGLPKRDYLAALAVLYDAYSASLRAEWNYRFSSNSFDRLWSMASSSKEI